MRAIFVCYHPNDVVTAGNVAVLLLAEGIDVRLRVDPFLETGTVYVTTREEP